MMPSEVIGHVSVEWVSNFWKTVPAAIVRDWWYEWQLFSLYTWLFEPGIHVSEWIMQGKNEQSQVLYPSYLHPVSVT